MGWWRGHWIKALKLFWMIERFKIFSPSLSHRPQSESQLLLRVLDFVTQRCGYKSTDLLTCFVQLFIACFRYALFSLILTHSHLCMHVCVWVCLVAVLLCSEPSGSLACLVSNMYRCLLKLNLWIEPLSFTLSFSLCLWYFVFPSPRISVKAHGRYTLVGLNFTACFLALKTKFIVALIMQLLLGGQ